MTLWDETEEETIDKFRKEIYDYYDSDSRVPLLSNMEEEQNSEAINFLHLGKKYSIEREKSVSFKGKNGRIDLFIIDSSEKFIIVIENKKMMSEPKRKRKPLRRSEPKRTSKPDLVSVF